MTVFDFVPSSVAPFQFQPTLDGQVFTAIVNWNLFGARYYVNLYSLGGDLVFCQSLVGSPTGVDNLSLTWSQGSVTVETAAPHGHSVGEVVELTISGAAPDAYNGTHPCEITGPGEFRYLEADNPGMATLAGRSDYNLSLAAGYFSSTLVYRQANRQFEVSP